MKWLRKIIGLCVHQYETVDECILKRNGIVQGKVYVQKCKHCGKMHNHVLDVTDYQGLNHEDEAVLCRSRKPLRWYLHL